jgi:hypothetical protein
MTDDKLSPWPTTAELVEAVKAHASRNYEKRGGWDIIVECYSDGEIEDMVRGCRSKSGAIKKVGQTARLLDDRRRDIQNA